MPSYLLTGPNGVGKSTLAERLVVSQPETFRRITGSAVLKASLGVTTYEELGKFTDDEKNATLNQAMIDLLTTSDGSSTVNIIDSHLLYFNRGNVSSSTMPWVTLVDGIAALYAPAEIMFARIKADAASGRRERSALPPGVETDQHLATALLAGYVATNSSFAQQFGAQHDIPVVEIDTSGPVDQVVNRFMAAFMTQNVMSTMVDGDSFTIDGPGRLSRPFGQFEAAFNGQNTMNYPMVNESHPDYF